MSGKVIFVDENIPLLADMLNSCGDVHTFTGRSLKNSILKKSGCKYLFVRSTTLVNKELLDGGCVEFVGTATSGTDHIDTDYLDSTGINFASAAGSNAKSVAEYVVYSIAKWAVEKNKFVKNKAIGIIGYGNIGNIVARYGGLMGMKVLINDPPLKVHGFNFPEKYEYVDLIDIFKNCDIITNHVPLTFSGEYPTDKLISSDEIDMIMSGSLFIHTSRGGVVDETFLIETLKEKKITAAIDVWENEPEINYDLANMAFIATPHVAGYSRDGKLKGALMMARAFEEYSSLLPDYKKIDAALKTGKHVNSDNFSNINFLYEQLKKSRRIDEDTRSLLRLNDKSREVRKKGFDRLRKEYPFRREIFTI